MTLIPERITAMQNERELNSIRPTYKSKLIVF
jgi:hypothetical protein